MKWNFKKDEKKRNKRRTALNKKGKECAIVLAHSFALAFKNFGTRLTNDSNRKCKWYEVLWWTAKANQTVMRVVCKTLPENVRIWHAIVSQLQLRFTLRDHIYKLYTEWNKGVGVTLQAKLQFFAVNNLLNAAFFFYSFLIFFREKKSRLWKIQHKFQSTKKLSFLPFFFVFYYFFLFYIFLVFGYFSKILNSPKALSLENKK